MENVEGKGGAEDPVSSYANQFTRIEIESSRYENGHLLVTGKGMAGERFEDMVWYEPHGFHSRPHKGAIGFLFAPGGRRDMAMVMAASDPKKLPQLNEGEAAMYEAGGAVVTLKADGWHFNTDLHIDGSITLTGGITAAGSIVDGDGDGGA